MRARLAIVSATGEYSAVNKVNNVFSFPHAVWPRLLQPARNINGGGIMAGGDVIGYNTSRMRVKRAKERAERRPVFVWTVLKPPWPLARLGTTVRIDTGSAVGPTNLFAVCFLRSSSRARRSDAAALRRFSNVVRTSRRRPDNLPLSLCARASAFHYHGVRHKAPLWLAVMIYQRERERTRAHGCTWKSSINENLSSPDPIEIGGAVRSSAD